MRPLLPLIITAIFAWFAAPLQAVAAEPWRTTQVAGEVRIEIAGGPAVPLTLATTIATDATIETAASGSATLVRGDDRVVVAPNSRLRLPADAGGFTRIIEEFGELFFQVGKRSAPHFRVDTPLLAATVKGTSFTVLVDHKGTNVEVNEGLVLVENSASADSTYVGAGRSASVMLNAPMTLYLDRSIVPPESLRLGDGSMRRELVNAEPAPPTMPHRSAKHQGQTNTAVPQIAFTTATNEMHRPPANAVIDSTLSGIGVGIIAAAIAIILIGTNKRRTGLVEAKPRRAAKGVKSE